MTKRIKKTFTSKKVRNKGDLLIYKAKNNYQKTQINMGYKTRQIWGLQRTSDSDSLDAFEMSEGYSGASVPAH